ncbi:MAG: chemotaxis protein CheW [Bacteroidales bacterium]|nr:chemotaxis protein CheW [Bacteroidales bacterium]
MEEKENLTLNSYLSFKLGEETFASNVSKVLNILEMMKITKVPKSPSYMKGVINLRGAVLPLVDTRLKFGMTQTEITTNTCILVLDVKVNGESINISAMVDSVQEVIELEESDIQPPPNIGSKYKSEFIYGMIKVDEKFIMLLDMDKVFSTDEVIMVKEKAAKGKGKIEDKEGGKSKKEIKN